VLKYYDKNKPIILQCDASNKGLGSALLQKGQLVYYALRSLTATEAIVFGCSTYDQYNRRIRPQALRNYFREIDSGLSSKTSENAIVSSEIWH
jgi:hypothetical protein